MTSLAPRASEYAAILAAKTRIPLQELPELGTIHGGQKDNEEIMRALEPFFSHAALILITHEPTACTLLLSFGARTTQLVGMSPPQGEFFYMLETGEAYAYNLIEKSVKRLPN